MGVHARLDELGPSDSGPGPGAVATPRPESRFREETAPPSPVVAGPGAPRADDIRPLSPGARTAVRAPGAGPVPAPSFSDEPIRLSVTPAVPGYDPNEPSRPYGYTVAPAVDAGQTKEEAIEDFLATDVSLSENQRLVKRLLERAEEHVQRARTYRALKNRPQSRISYQRALHYYEEVLEIESGNNFARKGRSECLTRIPT
jgi:hypothetical protein